MDQVRKIAKEKGAEVAHVVLAWYLEQDGIDVLILGTKRANKIFKLLMKSSNKQ